MSSARLKLIPRGTRWGAPRAPCLCFPFQFGSSPFAVLPPSHLTSPESASHQSPSRRLANFSHVRIIRRIIYFIFNFLLIILIFLHLFRLCFSGGRLIEFGPILCVGRLCFWPFPPDSFNSVERFCGFFLCLCLRAAWVLSHLLFVGRGCKDSVFVA